ncbi:SPFH domain-containing protein [Thalassospira xiamenensis]|uniref:SPFH domain, Band 7 family protein n=1 Tax=Thalassospira xiamenensis TaxID=220697 RepID=A0A285TS51_9PROT|nr:SPFH domain-containing protein [Thalassospira xiamenensis]SOC26284.1 SPFH domain, Band 7 family protein [Thalassospira xiamenensis]
MILLTAALYLLAAAIVPWVLWSSVNVLFEYERATLHTFGKYRKTVGPGLRIIVPLVQTLRRADTRITVMKIPPQDLISMDNVSVKVAAIVSYRIKDVKDALLGVSDYSRAIPQEAQAVLRATVGEHPIDDLLSNQDKINEEIQIKLDTHTSEWGIQIDRIEITRVDFSEGMIRAMAQEAEAARSARARKIIASGEREAAKELAQAAELLGQNPAALTLRTLSTMAEIGREHNTMIIVPVDQSHMMGRPASSLIEPVASAVSTAVAKGATRLSMTDAEMEKAEKASISPKKS